MLRACGQHAAADTRAPRLACGPSSGCESRRWQCTRRACYRGSGAGSSTPRAILSNDVRVQLPPRPPASSDSDSTICAHRSADARSARQCCVAFAACGAGCSRRAHWLVGSDHQRRPARSGLPELMPTAAVAARERWACSSAKHARQQMPARAATCAAATRDGFNTLP